MATDLLTGDKLFITCEYEFRLVFQKWEFKGDHNGKMVYALYDHLGMCHETFLTQAEAIQAAKRLVENEDFV